MALQAPNETIDVEIAQSLGYSKEPEISYTVQTLMPLTAHDNHCASFSSNRPPPGRYQIVFFYWSELQLDQDCSLYSTTVNLPSEGPYIKVK
jgi:hypothetical protein